MPTILATFSSWDLKLWPVTVTYELDLDKVKLNHRAKYLGESSGHFVRKLLCGHTHRHTDTHTTNRLRYTATKWSVNTPWAIIRSQLIFVCNFVKKTNFNAVYDVRFRNERHMRQYELHPPHLISVATLWKSKHRKCNITVGYYQRKLHQMYHSFIKVDQGHHVPEIYLWVLYSKACMKQRFTTSTVCKNAWCKLVSNANLFRLWPEHHRCWRNHVRLCACWWWIL